MDGFTTLPLTTGLLLQRPGLDVHGLADGHLELGEGTTYGIVTAGSVRLRCSSGEFVLGQGMFFVVPGGFQVAGGTALLLSLPAWTGLFQIGGPLEARGRLRYIDGCSDTLLTCPPRLGDPCLNHLHIPSGTRQTAHTHPSDRLGVIAGGHGRCITDSGVHPLEAGVAWWIPTGTRHCFHTDLVPLDVVAWHPDSDFGPTDTDHPMINRTILPG